MRRRTLCIWLFAGFALLALVAVIMWIETGRQGSEAYYHPPPRTKVSGCISIHALPDPACTPGAVDTSMTKELLCAGRTRERRHTSITVEREAFASYGFSREDGVAREDDHLISLELGGADNDVANHFPQIYEDPRALKAGALADDDLGAHAKDKVENWLHRRVCNGEVPLSEAQRMIATNWVAAYHQYLERPKHSHQRR